MKIRQMIPLLVLGSALILAGCNNQTPTTSDPSSESETAGSSTAESDRKIAFAYDDVTFENTYGDKTNAEEHDYEGLIVNPLTNKLRDDFAYGVDASMIGEVERLGGVFYNEDGKEQDIFQILANDGVNFFRVRLWNKPSDRFRRGFGGGNNDAATDIELCKRAQAVGMNICVDFHYSDFWADPDKQQIPQEWQAYDADEIPDLLHDFTVDTLNEFKEEGVEVDAVQIGNEINNGMMGRYGTIDWNNMDESFEYISSLLKSGIQGMKEVFPDAYSIIHLANGTNADEFETYFSYLDKNGVDYDIVGASYYPALTGDLSRLQENLDNISEKTGHPVMVMETSWGFTDDYVDGVTANSYSSEDEDTGGYLTSEQAQATSLRDVLDVLSKVPDQMGLGCFYWEPCWLPVSKDGEVAGWATKYGQSYADYGDTSHNSLYTDGLATWSNQGWFSYTGKELASAKVYRLIQEGGANATEEKSLSARATTYAATINLAADETLPTTGKVVTNLDAIRDAEVVWNEEEAAACVEVGEYVVHGLLDGQYEVTLNAECIENYIVDPGFELQGGNDALKDPWTIRSVTPEGNKIVKLDRKSDTRTGTTDLNWYYGAGDFTFDFYQSIEDMPAGTYDLTTYILAPSQSEFAQTLTLYVKIDGVETTFDLSPLCVGWGSGYQEANLLGLEIKEGADIEVGIRGECASAAWAHNDDWKLIRR